MKLPHNKERFIATLLLLVLPLVYFSPAVKGDVLLATGDAWAYSLPVRVLLGQMIRSATLPLWNPFTFAGMPLLASVQPGVLYPLNWLFAILPPGAAMNAVTILSYHVALIGTYRFARAWQFQRTSSLIAAITFTFGGFMVSHLEFTNYVAAAAWLPWILLAIEKLSRANSWRARWRWIIAGSAFVALQTFAGLPQATWQTLLVCAPYFVFALLRNGERERPDSQAATFKKKNFSPTKKHEEDTKKDVSFFQFFRASSCSFVEELFSFFCYSRRRLLLAAALLALCGGLLSMIQLLPTIELQQQGERAAIPYEAYAAFPYAPRFLLTLVFPYFFGGAHPPLDHVGAWEAWWLVKYGYGYVGLTGLLLVAVALFAAWRHAQVWCWLTIAALALFAAFGDYLPFNFNHLLYRVPVWNLFRGSYRHLFEFTFAAAMLAGIGAECLLILEFNDIRRTLNRASLALTALVIAVTICYALAERMGAPSSSATRLLNPEALVPLVMFVLAVSATSLFLLPRLVNAARWLLALVLFLDLMSFGFFTYWRTAKLDLVQQLRDSQTVTAIKSRERDAQSFRTISQATWPYGENYAAINHANLTMPRGVQSVSGYDPMRLPRVTALLGGMDIFGSVRDHKLYQRDHRGLDLLNVKYLIRERSSAADERINRVRRDGGIYYHGILNELKLEPGDTISLEADRFTADQLTTLSTMIGGAELTDDTVIASLRIHQTNGNIIERDLRAGRDTAEWAHVRPALNQIAHHQRAEIIQSWQATDDRGNFTVHRYRGTFRFDRNEIDSVEIISRQPKAVLLILRMNLLDSASGHETPLDRWQLPADRWRLIERGDAADVYENLRAMPRAWFVRETISLNDEATLRAITTGRLPDGNVFDPLQTALVAERTSNSSTLSQGNVSVVRYAANQLELVTENSQAGFLVLSEIDYPGWQALIDGAPTKIQRANYILRGVAVPAGNHRLEFIYRPKSVQYGLLAFSAGLLILIAGWVVVRKL